VDGRHGERGDNLLRKDRLPYGRGSVQDRLPGGKPNYRGSVNDMSAATVAYF